MKLHDLKRGLEIITRYVRKDDYFCAEHDQIWVMHSEEYNQMTDKEKKELDDLGFFWDSATDSLSAFC